MKIVVLDGYTLNPGDLSWGAVERLGKLSVYDRTAPEQVAERAAGAEALLTNKTPLTRRDVEELPELKYIGVLATGYNIVNVEAARAHGISVTNVPAYATRSVAQMVFAHLLNLALRLGEHARAVREGRWTTSPDFSFWHHPLIELASLTMGIVGLGQTGRATAAAAQAFGMEVLGYDTAPDTPPEGVKIVDLETLFVEADVVSLHCPLTADNQKLVNDQLLGLMKPTAFLINTARGQLVDEAALAEYLNSGRIAGAGLDVLAIEPPTADNPLLSAKNCYITPHQAWATRSARQRLLAAAAENLRAFLEGKPTNVVNPP